MANKIFVTMPNINSIPAGGSAGTVVHNLPVGKRYHFLVYRLGEVALADILQVRVNYNGRTAMRFTGAEWDTINQYLGMTPYGGGAGQEGYLVILFDRFNLLDKNMEQLTAINTGYVDPATGLGITALSVEIDLAATTILNPTVAGWASQDDVYIDPVPLLNGNILYRNPFTYNMTGAGELQISDLPKNGTTTLNIDKIMIFSTQLSELRIERDNFTFFQRDVGLNNFITDATSNWRVSQANFFPFDPSEWGYGGDTLNLAGVQDFRLRLTMGGAEVITCMVDYIGRLDG